MQQIETDARAAATIVAVSGGYPNEYEKGILIDGLDEAMENDVFLFQAGTKNNGENIVTNGGRVLCATALGNDLDEAINKSRDLVETIQFRGKYFRRDIGFEFL